MGCAPSSVSSVKRIKVKRVDVETGVESVHDEVPQYQNVMDELVSSGEKYSDQQFPASLESIIRNKSDPRYQTLKDSKWLRLPEIVEAEAKGADKGKPMQMFLNIDPQDIRQGFLGVCYFLCSISLLAEKKQMVRDCFNTKEVNAQGLYSVNFFVMGSRHEVLLDDQFPTVNHGHPLFSRPVGPEVWVMLLEKAWCKMFRTFTLAEGGLPHVSMEYLTGCPSQSYGSHSDEKLWKDRKALGAKIMGYEREQYF